MRFASWEERHSLPNRGGEGGSTLGGGKKRAGTRRHTARSPPTEGRGSTSPPLRGVIRRKHRETTQDSSGKGTGKKGPDHAKSRKPGSAVCGEGHRVPHPQNSLARRPESRIPLAKEKPWSHVARTPRTTRAWARGEGPDHAKSLVPRSGWPQWGGAGSKTPGTPHRGHTLGRRYTTSQSRPKEPAGDLPQPPRDKALLGTGEQPPTVRNPGSPGLEARRGGEWQPYPSAENLARSTGIPLPNGVSETAECYESPRALRDSPETINHV
jgi:hypothetical protein